MITDYLLLSKIYYIFFINVYLIRSVSLWYCYSWATITVISIMKLYKSHYKKCVSKSFFLFNVCFRWVIVQLISKSVSLSFLCIFCFIIFCAWCSGILILLSRLCYNTKQYHFQILRVSISLKTLFCFWIDIIYALIGAYLNIFPWEYKLLMQIVNIKYV